MSNIHSIMYSGGVDSFLVYQKLRKYDYVSNNLNMIYYNLGARCNNCEIDLFNSENFKKHVTQPIMISDCLNMGNLEEESAYIPNRNILAAVMTNSVTDADNIWIGGTLSDRVNDNNEEVFVALSNLLTMIHERPITVTSPFFDQHKCTLVKDYVLNNGWNYYTNKSQARMSLIESTFSCYNPIRCNRSIQITLVDTIVDTINEIVEHQTRECLECSACFRKCMSLYAGGIFIPMRDTDTANAIVQKYKDEATREIVKHDIMYERYYATLHYCQALEDSRT